MRLLGYEAESVYRATDIRNPPEDSYFKEKKRPRVE
jgi:hypothetical protein